MEYTKLMAALDNCCKERITITVKWDNGCVFKSNGNTGSFESNNSLDEGDVKYKEYFACLVHVSDIIRYPTQSYFELRYGELCVGKMLEVSEFNEPSEISYDGGIIIWKRDGTEY